MCCEKNDKKPCLIASLNILIYKISKLENNIDFMDSITKGLNFVLKDLDSQIELGIATASNSSRRSGTSQRFASLEPVQPTKVPHGVQFAINYFFGFHGLLVLAYFIRKNWELICQSHNMSQGSLFSEKKIIHIFH